MAVVTEWGRGVVLEEAWGAARARALALALGGSLVKAWGREKALAWEAQ